MYPDLAILGSGATVPHRMDEIASAFLLAHRKWGGSIIAVLRRRGLRRTRTFGYKKPPSGDTGTQ